MELRRGDVGRNLETIEGGDRLALERPCSIARELVPEAEQGTSYAVAAVIHRGKGLIATVKAKKFLALYPLGWSIIARRRGLLDGFETTTGSVHYSAECPVPGDTLRSIVAACREEIDARGRQPPGRRRSSRPADDTGWPWPAHRDIIVI